MKIAIEAQRIFRTNKHGMDFVALETIRELQKIDKENEYFIFVSPGEDRCLEESENMHIIEVKCPTYPMWEQLALPDALRKVKPDILHCTSNTAPMYIKIPLVLTLHDIIFLEPRQSSSKSLYQNLGWYYRRIVVPRILSDCRKVITVSDFERGRIMEALELPGDKVVTIHNGYSKHFRPMEDFRSTVDKYLSDPRYIFFLGNTDPKKNTPRTLKAYAIYARKAEKPLPLLIADLKEPVIDSILKEQDIEDIKPLLRFPGYIPNSDLAAIYNGAEMFLYTSLRESFGIPSLEAMACGTPVLTSNTSAIPEVVGAGAVMVDPNNEEEIADRILSLTTDEAFRQTQIAYGLDRVKGFSWKKTAEKLLKVYKSIEI